MKSSKINHYIDLIRLKKKLNNTKIFFFFPFYHIGGAERVHIDILNVFKDLKTVCIITSKSSNNYFYEEFNSNTELIEIEAFNNKYQQKYIDKIVSKINDTKNSVVLGCNSGLFYNLIPLFKNHVKIIDLIHAFSYEEKNSAEKFSLPLVDRIDNRIILGKKTYTDFEKLYQENEIDLKNLNKIKIIKNKVEVPLNPPLKPTNEKLKILFVGRNSYEKRPGIFFKIAEKCLEKKLAIEFIVIGDFNNLSSTLSNVKIEGLITNKKTLIQQYTNADLLLITSSREGFPMVILESMAYGVIPISTDVGEINEFINNENKNGFLITNDPDEEKIIIDFVEKITLLLEDNNLLKEMQSHSYQTIEKNYKTEIFTKSYKSLFIKK